VADYYKPEDFRDSVGETFEVDARGERISMVLDDYCDLPAGIREHGCFRLRFRGPSDPLVPQGLYSFERRGAAYEIFVVPIAQDPKGATYEAIFN
jgi:hypothetical protein